MKMIRETATIHTYGMHKVAGVGRTYKVADEDVPFLVARGWRQVPNKGRSYAYMIAPAGYALGNVGIEIQVEVPDEAELEVFANEVHAAGVRAQGTIGEWAWNYWPHYYDGRSLFEIGRLLVWHQSVRFEKAMAASA